MAWGLVKRLPHLRSERNEQYLKTIHPCQPKLESPHSSEEKSGRPSSKKPHPVPPPPGLPSWGAQPSLIHTVPGAGPASCPRTPEQKRDESQGQLWGAPGRWSLYSRVCVPSFIHPSLVQPPSPTYQRPFWRRTNRTENTRPLFRMNPHVRTIISTCRPVSGASNLNPKGRVSAECTALRLSLLPASWP